MSCYRSTEVQNVNKPFVHIVDSLGTNSFCKLHLFTGFFDFESLYCSLSKAQRKNLKRAQKRRDKHLENNVANGVDDGEDDTGDSDSFNSNGDYNGTSYTDGGYNGAASYNDGDYNGASYNGAVSYNDGGYNGGYNGGYSGGAGQPAGEHLPSSEKLLGHSRKDAYPHLLLWIEMKIPPPSVDILHVVLIFL